MHATARWVLTAVCLTAVSCRPNAPTVQVGPDDAHAPAAATTAAEAPIVQGLDTLGLKVYWSLPLNLQPREQILRLVRLDEKLYCITNQNCLIVVDAMRGVPVWRHSIADPGEKIFDPVNADEMVIPDRVIGIRGLVDPRAAEKALPYDGVMINTLTYLMVFDRNTGRVVRDRNAAPFHFPASSSGSTDGSFFFVATAAGSIVGFRPAEAIAAREFKAECPISATPVYFDNHVFVATENNLFFSIERKGQWEILWSQDLTGPVTAPFHVGPLGAFVPCEDMQLYAFDPFTGKELWESPFMTAGPCRTAVQVGSKTVFQYADGDRLYAVNLFDGTQRWSMPDGRILMALMNDKAYVLDKDRVLHVMDEMTGAESGTVSLADYDVLLANTTAPAIFAAKSDGELVCIRPADAERLTAEILEATPRPQ